MLKFNRRLIVRALFYLDKDSYFKSSRSGQPEVATAPEEQSSDKQVSSNVAT